RTGMRRNGAAGAVRARVGLSTRRLGPPSTGGLAGLQDPARGQRIARHTVARPTSATTASAAPEKLLDQYIGVAIVNFASRMNDEMSTQMPSTRPTNCRPGNPRGLARAKAPTPAAVTPAIKLAVAALVPPCCSVRKSGEMATHSPMRMPSAAAAWAVIPRLVAGRKYSAAAELAGMAMGDWPPGSGRRVSGLPWFVRPFRLRALRRLPADDAG